MPFAEKIKKNDVFIAVTSLFILISIYFDAILTIFNENILNTVVTAILHRFLSWYSDAVWR